MGAGSADDARGRPRASPGSSDRDVPLRHDLPVMTGPGVSAAARIERRGVGPRRDRPAAGNTAQGFGVIGRSPAMRRTASATAGRPVEHGGGQAMRGRRPRGALRARQGSASARAAGRVRRVRGSTGLGVGSGGRGVGLPRPPRRTRPVAGGPGRPPDRTVGVDASVGWATCRWDGAGAPARAASRRGQRTGMRAGRTMRRGGGTGVPGRSAARRGGGIGTTGEPTPERHAARHAVPRGVLAPATAALL
jgi:hypothetical protein